MAATARPTRRLPADRAERVGDALRAAVERTLAATADSATETRQRAQSLLDDVVRRGQVAREEVTRRGEEATTRLGGGDRRPALGRRARRWRSFAAGSPRLEARLDSPSRLKTNPQVEPE